MKKYLIIACLILIFLVGLIVVIFNINKNNTINNNSNNASRISANVTASENTTTDNLNNTVEKGIFDETQIGAFSTNIKDKSARKTYKYKNYL